MTSIFSRMGRVYRVLRRTFGVKVVPLFIAVVYFVMLSFSSLRSDPYA